MERVQSSPVSGTSASNNRTKTRRKRYKNLGDFIDHFDILWNCLSKSTSRDVKVLSDIYYNKMKELFPLEVSFGKSLHPDHPPNNDTIYRDQNQSPMNNWDATEIKVNANDSPIDPNSSLKCTATRKIGPYTCDSSHYLKENGLLSTHLVDSCDVPQSAANNLDPSVHSGVPLQHVDIVNEQKSLDICESAE